MVMLGPTEGIQWPNTDYPSSEQRRMRPLVVGNWKMNGLAEQLSEIEAMAISVKATLPSVDALICLPATLIAQAVLMATGRIAIGGEDCSAEICGAFTGDISAEMLMDAGAHAVIVGHSERRQQHAETDAVVAAKANAARRAGLLAIICIGETHSQRLAGTALSVCARQITGSVPEGMTASNTVIGYEPLWAIGSDEVPTHSQIMQMHAHIRACLTQRLGAEGQKVRILYGGSVKPSSADAILRLPQVGGVLVGGASLKAADFLAICRAAPLAPAHTPTRPKEQRR
ncbi:triose-phosphate isomerase [Pseudomonas antarctica]|nr:triose-phosphate isomerase [Pseudomonas antarctica]